MMSKSTYFLIGGIFPAQKMNNKGAFKNSKTTLGRSGKDDNDNDSVVLGGGT